MAYQPSPAHGKVDQAYLQRELKRIADELVRLNRAIEDLIARVEALETP